MIPVYLSDNTENGIKCQNILSKSYAVTLITDTKATTKGTGKGIFIICSEKMILKNISDAIIVLGDHSDSHNLGHIGENNIVIIPSDNKQLISAMAEKRITAITYGFCPKSTVTFSSISEETAVISLQRNIKTVDGRTVEPLDFPIDNNALNNVLLYSACLQLILHQ